MIRAPATSPKSAALSTREIPPLLGTTTVVFSRSSSLDFFSFSFSFFSFFFSSFYFFLSSLR